MGVRAGARGARHRQDPRALRPLRRRGGGRAEDRGVVPVDLTLHRGAALRGCAGGGGGRRPRRRRGARRFRERLVGPRTVRAREVPLPARALDPGALARARRGRVPRRRQADPGVARRRRPARCRTLLLLRRLGGQARVRVSGSDPAAAGCRGTDHPLELPAAHARVEDRACARLWEHGRAEAGRDDSAHRHDLRGHLPPGRAAARRRQPHHGRRLDRARTSCRTRGSTSSRSPVRPRSGS